MIHDEKGVSVWVSAVLYFGIGIVIIAIILAAGMPVVDRMRDKNVATQTKEVFFEFDKVLKEVAKEGGGSQRVMTMDIKKGEVIFDEVEDTITWTFRTKAVLSEPGQTILEGQLNIITEDLGDGNYNLIYSMTYYCALDISTGLDLITGTRGLVISNSGVTKPFNCDVDTSTPPEDIINIVIKEV